MGDRSGEEVRAEDLQPTGYRSILGPGEGKSGGIGDLRYPKLSTRL
ncbi:MAG: hypothetical protein GXO19_07575 [Epsilonproteobacteria bacterium]|nr:hypothetical protein [Campylobacterota bacterium]